MTLLLIPLSWGNVIRTAKDIVAVVSLSPQTRNESPMSRSFRRNKIAQTPTANGSGYSIPSTTKRANGATQEHPSTICSNSAPSRNSKVTHDHTRSLLEIRKDLKKQLLHTVVLHRLHTLQMRSTQPSRGFVSPGVQHVQIDFKNRCTGTVVQPRSDPVAKCFLDPDRSRQWSHHRRIKADIQWQKTKTLCKCPGGEIWFRHTKVRSLISATRATLVERSRWRRAWFVK